MAWSLINPRRACAARVTVVVAVCLCVCLSVKSHLTLGGSEYVAEFQNEQILEM